MLVTFPVCYNANDEGQTSTNLRRPLPGHVPRGLRDFRTSTFILPHSPVRPSVFRDQDHARFVPRPDARPGGQVLHARRLQDGTRIEILQLPLTESQQPTPDLTKSQGRFMAVQREFLDPATIPHGTFVTVTGELTGSMTLPLDETEYTYPVLDIKDLRTWVPDYSFPRIRLTPYYSPFWHPYWGPYGRGYPYFW